MSLTGLERDAAALMSSRSLSVYVIPSEGSQLWEDDWAIAAGTSDPELAHAFVNFMLRPAIAAQEARYTRYATGNRRGWHCWIRTFRRTQPCTRRTRCCGDSNRACHRCSRSGPA